MTGPSSELSSLPTVSPTTTTLIFSSTTVVSVVTASAERSIICEDSNGSYDEGETGGGGGIVDSACESAALSIISVLATATRTIAIQTATATSTTSPPVVSDYAANFAAATPNPSPSPTSLSGTSTPTSTVIGLTSASTSSSAKQSPEMVEVLIIIGLTIGAVILLFWIWRRYASVSEYCPHIDCNHSKARKNWDGMMRRIKIMAIMAARGPGHREIDAEKGLQPVTPITSNSIESEREAEIAATRRQIFEEAMRKRESRRASKRTILAELEGDFSLSESSAAPPMPTEIDLESRDHVPELQIKRKTMVGQGQSGVVVRGRDAAVIVAVGKKGHGASSSRVISERDLPPIPFNRTSDEDQTSSPILSILYVKGEFDDDDDDDGDDVVSDCHCGFDDPSSEEQSRFDYPTTTTTTTTSSGDEAAGERSRLDDATPPSPRSEVEESKGKGKELEMGIDPREEARIAREERKERLRYKRNQMLVLQRKVVAITITGREEEGGGSGSAGSNPNTTPWEFMS